MEDGKVKTLGSSSLGALLSGPPWSYMTVFALAGTPGMPLFAEGPDSCSLASSVRRWSQCFECDSLVTRVLKWYQTIAVGGSGPKSS